MKGIALSWVKRRMITPYLFISPFFILFIIFMVGPLFYVIYLGFNVGARGGKYIFGLGNYFFLLGDEVFWQVFYNTTYYALIDVSLRVVLSLTLAVILNSALVKLKGMFRTLFFTPVLISSVVVSTIFIVLLNQRYGMVNVLLGRLGLPAISWLRDRNVVKLSVIGVLEWRWVGYSMVYFLAGLQTIPEELYEAATVDGASKWQSFWNITLPLLKPVIALVIILSLIGAYKMFDTPYLLTEGGPGQASSTLAIYLYRNAFIYGKFEYASALGFVLFIIIFIITLIQGKLLGIFAIR